MKKSFVFLLALVSLVALCSCFESLNIEDTNGEDTALCSITEEDILAGNVGSTTFGSSKRTINDETTYSVMKMSGVLTLDTFKVPSKDEYYVLTVTPRLKSGNLRVLLLGDGEYLVDFPLSETTTLFLNDPDMKYELVLAAESAEFSVEFKAVKENCTEKPQSK